MNVILRHCAVFGAAIGLATLSAHHVVALGPTVTAVRTLDESVVQLNQIDVSATAMTSAQMTLDVAAAFDAGVGGVIDFDNGTFTDPQTIDAVFAGGAKQLRLTNSARTWSIGVLGPSPGSGAISGGQVIFLGAPPSVLNRFVFGEVTSAVDGAVLPERVYKFGFTIIDGLFGGQPNNLTITARYSDGTSETLMHTIPPAPNTADTFFGFTAPAGRFLTEVEMVDSINTAGEDFAFITRPVAEPSSGALGLGAALLGVGLGRGRGNKRALRPQAAC